MDNDIYDFIKREKEEEKLFEIACEIEVDAEMKEFESKYPEYDKVINLHESKYPEYDKVINLHERMKKDDTFYISGLAKCIDCKHEWVAVSEQTYDEFLECPSCGLHKGKYVYPYMRDGLVWTCECGNTLMQICPDGRAVCPNCSRFQYYDNAHVMMSTRPDYLEKESVNNIPGGITISVITIQNTKTTGSLLISNDGVNIEIPTKLIDEFIEKVKKHSYTHAIQSQIKYEKPRILK